MIIQVWISTHFGVICDQSVCDKVMAAGRRVCGGLGRAFAGAVASGAGTGGAEGLDAIPVFGAADQAGLGAA